MLHFGIDIREAWRCEKDPPIPEHLILGELAVAIAVHRRNDLHNAFASPFRDGEALDFEILPCFANLPRRQHLHGHTVLSHRLEHSLQVGLACFLFREITKQALDSFILALLVELAELLRQFLKGFEALIEKLGPGEEFFL